jgi:pimeloyl-ACP methyl ester carboxylesterase
LYASNPVLPGSAEVIAKVNRVVFLSSIFGGPTEEVPPPTGLATFPLAVNGAAGAALGWSMPQGRDAPCDGHVIPGSQEQSWRQTMDVETVGREWGGTDPLNPTGLNRSPTFFGYGWNAAVAGQLTTPTLVMQGLEDTGVPGGAATAPAIYGALPASMTNKLLVQVECASHQLPVEGCNGPRCTPAEGPVYGAPQGSAWSGPHATLKAALVEWITSGTFNGAASGRFLVNGSGVASQTGS